MQHRAQSLIRTAPIGIECLCDLLEPYVRLMKRFVEHFEASQTHDATFGNWIGCRGRRTVRPFCLNSCAQRPGVALMSINSLNIRLLKQ
jgi:hypothetical protein